MKYLNLYNLLTLSLERLLVNQWVILRVRVQKVRTRKRIKKRRKKVLLRIKIKKSQKIKKRRRRVNNGRINNK
jgi:hypothetical protein